MAGTGIGAYLLTGAIIESGLEDTAVKLARDIADLPAHIREGLNSADPAVRGQAVGDVLALGGAAGAILTKEILARLPAAQVERILARQEYDVLLRNAGVIGLDGKPLTSYSHLTNIEKERVASILGAEKIESLGIGAQPIGRIAATGETGIDQIFKLSDGRYLIVEYKFGQSAQGVTLDGLQMADTWLTGANTGYDRLLEAVGRSEAQNIRAGLASGTVEKWLVNVDPFGGIRGIRLDALGSPSPAATRSREFRRPDNSTGMGGIDGH